MLQQNGCITHSPSPLYSCIPSVGNQKYSMGGEQLPLQKAKRKHSLSLIECRNDCCVWSRLRWSLRRRRRFLASMARGASAAPDSPGGSSSGGDGGRLCNCQYRPRPPGRRRGAYSSSVGWGGVRWGGLGLGLA